MCIFFLVVWFFRKFVFSCFSSCKSSFDISMSFTKLISVEIVRLIIRMTVWTYYKNTFSHPQSISECGFIKEVQKASDLDGCERISSDLIMKSRNIDEITQNISGRWLYFHSWNTIEKYRFSEIDRCLKSCFDMQKRWTEWSVFTGCLSMFLIVLRETWFNSRKMRVISTTLFPKIIEPWQMINRRSVEILKNTILYLSKHF